MKKMILLMFTVVFVSLGAFAQVAENPHNISISESHTTQQRCQLDEMNIALRNENPEFFDRTRADFKQEIAEYIANNDGTRGGGIITVPVHVIIVAPSAGSSADLSVARIQSQIDRLNLDFRRMNSDWDDTNPAFISDVADCQIEFCLASVDPSGNPTDGITRYYTSSTNIEGTIKPATSWGKTNYLNIWSAPLGGGTLGYAYFPNSVPSNRDGVVIGYQYFGDGNGSSFPFNKGRTATHEVGHWFGIDHIFNGCGSGDGISDTPSQSVSHGGCPSWPQSSCGSNDMYMNYMDYVDDRCMFMFSNGQAAVMNATLNTTRSSILAAAATVCEEVVPTCDDGVQNGDETGVDCGGTCPACPECNSSTPITGLNANPASNGTNVALTWDDLSGAITYQLKGRVWGSTGFASVLASSNAKNVGGLTPGTAYEWKVRAACGDGSITPYSILDLFTQPFVRLTEEAGISTQVLPNPVRNEFQLIYTSNSNENAEITISDILGRTMVSQKVNVEIGENYFPFSTENYSNGTYLVQVVGQNGKTGQHFLISK